MKGPGWYIILFVILVSFTVGTGLSRPPRSIDTQTPPVAPTYPSPPQYSNLNTPPATPTGTSRPVRVDEFQKGIHFNDWSSADGPRRVMYALPQTEESLKDLATTGANWISIIVLIGQETVSSTTIFRDSPMTASDDDLLRTIDLAHKMGIKVMLLPTLMLTEDPGHWPGQIGSTFVNEAQWKDWFASYRENINHYASFAQEAGADMLCIGKGSGGVHREDDWLQVIQEVRQWYKGPIISYLNPEENRITWSNAVDYIGYEAYFPLTVYDNPTVEDIKKAWIERGHIAFLENLSARFDKPLILTSIGYVSNDGVNRAPGNFNTNTPTDLQEQADCYQAALEVLWGRPWLQGIFWWQWSAMNFNWEISPQGKPAEDVLRKFYLSEENLNK